MQEVDAPLKQILLRLVESGHGRDLLLVAEEVHIHLMVPLIQRQIDAVEQQIAHGPVLVMETVNIHIGHHQEGGVSRGILEIRIQHPLQRRQVGEGIGDHLQIDLVQLHMDSLRPLFLGGQGMNPKRRVVRSTQSQVGLDVFQAPHRDVVVWIQAEGVEGQDGLIGIEAKAHTALLLLLGTHTQIHAHLSCSILIEQVGIRIAPTQSAIYARAEGGLLPVFLFDHLRLIAQA